MAYSEAIAAGVNRVDGDYNAVSGVITAEPSIFPSITVTSGGDAVTTGNFLQPFIIGCTTTSAGGAAQTLTIPALGYRVRVLDFWVVYDEDPADDKDVELQHENATVIATASSGLAAVLYQSIDTSVGRAGKIENGTGIGNLTVSSTETMKVVFETALYDCKFYILLARI